MSALKIPSAVRRPPSAAERQFSSIQGAGRARHGGCYLCQQAGEKALKAFLYSTGTRRIVGHSLLALSRRCARHDKVFNDFAGVCRRLDRCYISARYPNGVPAGIPGDYFDRDDAEEAIVYAKSVIDLVKSKVAFPMDDEV